MVTKSLPIPCLTDRDLERFLSFVDIESRVRDGLIGPCWVWTGHVSFDGYGSFSMKDQNGEWRSYKAHRISYTIWNGPILDGLEPDHLCPETGCISPDHLEAVTHRTNVIRSKGTSCQIGHPYHYRVSTDTGLVSGYCPTCKGIRPANRLPTARDSFDRFLKL